jgi:hypothetical protein
MKLVKGNVVRLRSLGINEAYLEKFIQDDPTVLGLGDLVVLDRQRRQEKAGRLDLLLQDDSEDVRYEVELMLGSADESHLIRTIEYWDIERRRYPGYDHRAVLIAEDITTRFLNVITLFSGSIPIIALQVNAITVGEQAVVTFLRVVDSAGLRKDDQSEIADLKSTDRTEWQSRVGVEKMGLVDESLRFINEAAARPRTLVYNNRYIGLADGGQVHNFVSFQPRTSFLRVKFNNLDPPDPWVKRLEDAGLDFTNRDGSLKVKVTPKDFAENRDLISEMLHEAVKQEEKD